MKKTVTGMLALITVIIAILCACSPGRERRSNLSMTQTGNTPSSESNSSILEAYKSRLVENIYHYDNAKADELPTYALHDFDGDGIEELLIWDVRVASAAFRDIWVYKYNPVTGIAEHIGTMLDFSGHSVITKAADTRGIVIAIRDSGRQDKIIEYILKANVLVPKLLLARTAETSQEWQDKIYSPEFNSNTTLKTANTYEALEAELA